MSLKINSEITSESYARQRIADSPLSKLSTPASTSANSRILNLLAIKIPVKRAEEGEEYVSTENAG